MRVHHVSLAYNDPFPLLDDEFDVLDIAPPLDMSKNAWLAEDTEFDGNDVKPLYRKK